MNHIALQSTKIKKLQFQSLNKKIYCEKCNQLQYQKLFVIRNSIERQNAFKRHFLSIKNIPHFKIIQNQKKYIKVQFKKYYSVDQLSNFFMRISQVHKLKIIKQVFDTYINLMQIYGFFPFVQKAFKIDDNGKFVLWIYTDYQKYDASKKYLDQKIDSHTAIVSKQKQAIHTFLKVFGQFLSHKKIKQNAQLNFKQFQQVLRQIQRKNQLISKCPSFIKNKQKNKVSLKQVQECQKNNQKVNNFQFNAAHINKKKTVVQSLGNIEDRSKSKSKIKKLLSYNINNKDFISLKQQQTTLQQKNSIQNVTSKCKWSTNKKFQAIQQKFIAKKSKRTSSNLQNFQFSQKTFLNQKEKEKTHRRTNTNNIRKPLDFIKKFIPNQIEYFNQNPQSWMNAQKFLAKDFQKIRQSPKKQFFSKLKAKKLPVFKLKSKQQVVYKDKNTTKTFFTNNKRSQNLKTQYVELHDPQVQQTNQIKNPLTRSSSFTKQITLKKYKYKQTNQNMNKIQSCSNLSTYFMKQLQNTTSTAPTLKNSKSNQHFFLSSLNSFQCIRLQEELNQMFSSRTRNASIHIINQQKYEQLKNQVDGLLDF